MLNRFLNTGWKQGLAAGLLLGVLLAWLLHIGAPADFNLDKIVRFLSACPPFTLDVVLRCPEEVQLGLLIAWWALAGAALGHLLRSNAMGITIAVIFAFTLFTSHRLTYDNAGLAFRGAVHNFEHKFDFRF